MRAMQYDTWPEVLFVCLGMLVRLGFLAFFVWWSLQVSRGLRDITAELRGMRQSIDRASMKGPGGTT